jgi:NADH-quinone oxidoreductase subunit L
MVSILWLIPALPLASFIILALGGRRMPRAARAVLGCGSVGISAVIAFATAISFFLSPPEGHAAVRSLWTWFDVGGFAPEVALRLDPLSVVMMLVVTGVGFLIHLYSAEFMEDDEGHSRFFAYMNLFVGSMLVLVMANDLLLLYLGWEGVGLCSYLLIGFWYQDPANGRAAQKAFIVTRVGDTAMAVGLFILVTQLGTLNIPEAMARAGAQWPVGSALAVATAALLLGGAVGKSGQLPLQVWLPDAMAGPTPVSALIHAATMVTAGVYLIARTHVLFELAPPVMTAIAVVGALTLLLSAFSALVQRDIKRVLAYSTISQIGYMFLALGVGAWSAGIFHFMTHAFFKALLFLSAGVVIVASHHDHDIFVMGGLRHRQPVAFWTFTAASASLAGFPLVSAGFYSKDLILWRAWTDGGFWLWAAGFLGALLTGIYIFRVVYVVFFGKPPDEVSRRPGPRIGIPLVALAVLSLVGGFVEIPSTLWRFPAFSNFLDPVFGASHGPEGSHTAELVMQALAAAASLGGIGLATLWFLGRERKPGEALEVPFAVGPLQRFWFAGWGFDWIYDHVFVRPYRWISRVNRADVADLPVRALAWTVRLGHTLLRTTQVGLLRWYAAGLALGAILLLAVVILR